MIAEFRQLGLLVILAGLCLGAPSSAAQQPAEPDAPGQSQSAKRLNWPSAWHAKTDAGSGASQVGAPSPGQAGGSAPGEPKADESGAKSAAPEETLAPPARPAQADGGGTAPQTAPDAAGAASAPPDGGTAPAAAPAAAPTAVPELPAEIATGLKQAQGLTSRIETLEKAVERVKDRDKDLIEQLSAIEAVRSDAQRHGDELKPKLEDVRSQISRLGPAPDGKDVPPESAAIAAQRARLNAVAAEIDGAIKQAALVEVRARQLTGRVQELRQDIFTRDLLRRSRSPLAPSFWQEIWQAAPGAVLQVQAIANGWWSTVTEQIPQVTAILAGCLGLYVLLKLLTRRILRSLRGRTAEPTFYLKVSLASVQGPLRALPAIASTWLLYVGFDALGLMYLQVGYLTWRAFEAFATYKIASSWVKAYLQPSQPAWRVLELDDPTAKRLTRLIKLLVGVYAVELVLLVGGRLLYLPLPFSIVTTLFASLLSAALLAMIARTRFPLAVENDSPLALLRAELFRVPLLIAAVVMVAAAIGGYIALARYVGVQVLGVAAAVLLLLTFFLSNRAIAAEPDQNPGAQASAKDPYGLTLDLRRRIAGITAVCLDAVLLLIAIPVMLIAVGFSSTDIATLSDRALFGFEVGGVQISLARIAVALGIFAALILLTRMLRRWLSETVLHPKRIEQGLGNSISTGVNYLGIGIAALAGISYAGFDITNIALVAGALSVGIGFGLQSIVNNFVSGLILLVERPIKVGDWINVGGTNGHVRRISVRATEIETFDRASVIIPNSELITGTVNNLTHRNALGRVTIPVCVSYGTDAEHVMGVLMEIAENCSLVAKHPTPFVTFDNFGDKGLEFSLMAYVIDVSRSAATRNELRIAILKRFNEEGISFAHPRADLYMRDLDGLRALLGRIVEQRSRPAVKGEAEDDVPAAS
jgi:small-conductance mechanosensitive channel